jgi:hypothetical protein
VIFLGEYSHCGYKENLKKLGKIGVIVVNSRKKMLIKWKILTKFTTHKIEKRRKGKKQLYRGIYLRTLNKIWKNML